MRSKQVILFVLFVVISLLAARRQGLLKSVYSNADRDRELAELADKGWRYQRLRARLGTMRARLERANHQLAGDSLVYLPDAADPYAWANRQIKYLAEAAGVEVADVREEKAPALRERRGQREEAPRLFRPYRCRLEMAGDLEGMVKLVELAESRNPYLVVSGVYIGAIRSGDGHRTGYLILDWPTWADAELGRELVSQVESLDDLVDSPEVASPE